MDAQVTGHVTAKTPDRLLTSHQVADRLAVSIRTFWRLLSKGAIPHPVVRANRRIIRWRQSDIDAYIASLQPSPN